MTRVGFHSTMDRVRSLLIVDDHASFRSWAHDVLAHEGFHVVGESADGAAAIEDVRRLRPDVVLLDIRLPDMSGFDVARQIGGLASVVLTSSRSASDFGPSIGASPAVGFLAKSDLSGEALASLLVEHGR